MRGKSRSRSKRGGRGGKIKKKNSVQRKTSMSQDAAFNYVEKKSKFSDLEKQFEFPKLENSWQEKGKSQKILGTEYYIIESLSPILDGKPKLVEFELMDKEEVWSMGPNTCFKIKGQFQMAKVPVPPTAPRTWEACTAAECDKVVVQPNWFEAFIKNLEMFHGHSKINSSDEIRFVSSFVNAFKYNFMDKYQKKLLCPQPSCSGFAVPNARNSWNTMANSEWRNFCPNIFNEKTLSFDYRPIDFPPLTQGSNYMENQQNIVPMPLLDKVLIRFSFNDNLNSIFNITEGNGTQYRFYFQEIKLVVEKLKLNQKYKDTLMAKKGKWDYAGVTRIMKTENITPQLLNHKARIQGMLLPEGMFIFAVPKTVINGSYTFQGSDGNVFSKHNIKSLEIKYGDLPFFMTRPNLGMLRDDVIESKLFTDYLNSAPFGLNFDPDKVTVKNIENGWVTTPYPHVYINFCNYGDKSRIVPFINDGSILKTANDMEINFIFETAGAVADVTYVIYYFYTDNNLTLDTSHKNQSFFVSPYLKLV